jgi:hypothetical protein
MLYISYLTFSSSSESNVYEQYIYLSNHSFSFSNSLTEDIVNKVSFYSSYKGYLSYVSGF